MQFKNPVPISWFHYANVFFSISLVVGLFFSMPVISTSVIALSCLWFLEPNIIDRFKKLKNSKVSLFFLGFFLLHVVGLLWSDDMDYGFHDLNIKLPLLAMPIVLGAGYDYKPKETKLIWHFFIAAAVTSAFICVIYGYSNNLENHRDWSPFISHIRLSLMVVLAVFMTLIYAREEQVWSTWWITYIVVAAILVTFLYLLNALSGILILLILALYWVGLLFKNSIKSKKGIITGGVFLLAIMGFTLYTYSIANDFYTIKDVNWKQADKFSKGGEEYRFEWGNETKENGYYVKYYLADQELNDAWLERSDKPLYKADGSVTPQLEIVQRYMASKGLRKDREGVAQLSDADIEAIEKGMTNYRFLERGILYKRVYSTIWEVDRYYNGFGVSGGSLSQRFVYWKTAKQIALDHLWIGVGTGDVKNAFKEAYENQENPPEEKYRLRAHNQYLTIWLTFGTLGLLYFIWVLIAPFFMHRGPINLAFQLFWIIAILSMINEDTLETQVGVTFFAYFYHFTLYAGSGYLKKHLV